MKRFYVRENLIADKAFNSPKLVFDEFKDLGKADQESFWVLGMNIKNKPILKEMIALGAVDHVTIDPKIIFKRLIVSGSESFICVHNHPSGDPSPSKQDIELTKVLQEGGKILGLRLLDHVIAGETYYSFRENGLI